MLLERAARRVPGLSAFFRFQGSLRDKPLYSLSPLPEIYAPGTRGSARGRPLRFFPLFRGRFRDKPLYSLSPLPETYAPGTRGSARGRPLRFFPLSGVASRQTAVQPVLIPEDLYSWNARLGACPASPLFVVPANCLRWVYIPCDKTLRAPI